MTGAVLMFGVGATKAGTSWLYEYLARHPEVSLRGIKELHFFDAVDEGRREKAADELDRNRTALAAKLAADGRNAAYRAAKIAELGEWSGVMRQGATADYLEFVERDRGAAKVVGDITPAYGLLSVERLKEMAALRPVVRFVYLMRDPVARLWSHVRMIAKRRSETGAAEDIETRARRILARVLRGEESHISRRGDYAGVLGKLAHLDPRQVLVAFYEELFAPAGVGEICRFLGIGVEPAAYTERVHAGVPIRLTPDERRKAAAFLAPQYDAVSARMGRLPRAWEATMAEV